MNRALFEGAVMAPSLHVNTNALWKVTLGFIPSLVNLHKRLADAQVPVVHDNNNPQQDASTKMTDRSMFHSIYVAGEDCPDAESLSDISGDSSYMYSKASTGWTAADPIIEILPSIETSIKDESDGDSTIVSWYSANTTPSTVVTYSGSYYNFARNPEDNDARSKGQQYDTTASIVGSDRFIPSSEGSI